TAGPSEERPRVTGRPEMQQYDPRAPVTLKPSNRAEDSSDAYNDLALRFRDPGLDRMRLTRARFLRRGVERRGGRRSEHRLRWSKRRPGIGGCRSCECRRHWTRQRRVDQHWLDGRWKRRRWPRTQRWSRLQRLAANERRRSATRRGSMSSRYWCARTR